MATVERKAPVKKARVKTKAKKPNPAIGIGFDDFLVEEGIFSEASTEAAKRVIAWQLQQAITGQLGYRNNAAVYYTAEPVVFCSSRKAASGHSLVESSRCHAPACHDPEGTPIATHSCTNHKAHCSLCSTTGVPCPASMCLTRVRFSCVSD